MTGTQGMLVTPEWLAGQLGRDDLVVLDCSWRLKDDPGTGLNDYLAGHIPGARFLDIVQVADVDSPYATMLPSPERFARLVGALGIDNRTTVVITDATYISARGWFLFHFMGHGTGQEAESGRLHILDGGNRAWRAAGLLEETGSPARQAPRVYVPAPLAGRVVALEEMTRIVARGGAQIVDARSAARFTGEIASSHGALRPGHMPGAVNIPYARFQTDSGRFVDPETAANVFAAHGIGPDRPLVVTCGSGISALVPALMAERLGWQWRLYDGSWNEWAQQPGLPTVTGPATPVGEG